MARRKAGAPAKAAPRVGPTGVVVAAVLAVVVLLPIVKYPSANEFVLVDAAAALAGLAGIAAVVAILVRGRLGALRLSRVGVAWGAFMLAALVGGVISGRGWSAFMGQPTNMLGWGVLAALTAVALAASALDLEVRPLFERYAWIVLLVESALAFVRLSPDQVATGTLPNSTIFGCVVVLLLPWTISTAETPDTNVMRARWGTAILAVAALAASGSRVALIAAMAWVIWTVWNQKGWSVRTRASVLGVIALAAVVVGLYFAGPEFRSTFGSAVVGDRPDMWRMAAHALAAKPLLGWGPDGFVAGAASISTVTLAQTGRLLMVNPGATDPHDLLVWIAVSTGLVGLALFLWFCVEAVLRWLHSVRAAVPAIWAVGACTLVYLTAPAALQTLPLFALMVGLSLPAGANADDRGSAPASLAWVVPASVGVLGIAAVLVTANAMTRASFEAPSAATSSTSAPRVQSATRMWPFDAHLAYLASQHWAYVAHADPTVAAAQPDLAAIQRAVALDRRDPFYATELARFVQDYQEPATAVSAAYEAAFQRYPAYPIARALYATYLAKQGHVTEAQEQLRIAQLISFLPGSDADAALADARAAIAAAQAKPKTP